MHNEIIRKLLRKYAARMLLLLSIAVAVVLIGIISIELGRRIINLISTPSAVMTGQRQLLIKYCFYLLLAAIADGLAAYVLSSIYSRFSQAFTSDIREMLFNHLLRLPQSFFNKNPIGQITNLIMNEVGAIGSFFSSLFLFPVIHIFMITFYGFYLFRLNWKLAIAGTVFIPVCVLIFPIFNRRIERLTNDRINSSGNLTGYLQEVFTGVSDVRTSQTYFFEQFRLKQKLKELAGINVNSAKTAGGVEALTMTVKQFGPLALYFYGGILCLNNEMAVGTLVASIVAINNLYGPAKSMVTFFMDWRQASVRFGKLDEYLRLESEAGVLPSDEGGKPADGDIKFDKVGFGFTEGQPLLHDISFVTGHGEKVAFVGASGSGKSLTATLLGTIYKPVSGKISIGNQALDSIPLHDFRTQIGYVNQTPFLFNDTIRNNILYALLKNHKGNADDPDSWIDFSLMGDISKNELEQRIIDIVKEVGLFEDIIAIGLRSKPSSDKVWVAESNSATIIKIRNEIAGQIMKSNKEYVEFFREDKFLEFRTILENIVFCPSDAIIEKFGSTRQFSKKHLMKHLKERGLFKDLFAAGLKTCPYR
jgi:ABC-type bacteriocin/lantibiotic exporter with double-glycine peptidase domain